MNFCEDIVYLLAVSVRFTNARLEPHQRTKLILERTTPVIVELRVGRGQEFRISRGGWIGFLQANHFVASTYNVVLYVLEVGGRSLVPSVRAEIH